MTDQTNDNYEVRYLLNGDEQTDLLHADSAAEALELTQRNAVNEADDDFELIQVQLIPESEDEAEENA